MLIPEAVQLVLHAAAQAESGATYVLEMGEQVKVLDMARHLIRLSGLVPDEDIEIEFVGLRPGEKLYEELVGAGENVRPSAVEKILCVRSSDQPSPAILAILEEIELEAARGRTAEMMTLIRDLVSVGARTAVEESAPVPAIDRVAAPADEPLCPKCRTGRLHRSRARTWIERARKEVTPRRPFRCPACTWRGWLVPMEPGGLAVESSGDAPELTLLDSFSPLDLPRPFSPRDLAPPAPPNHATGDAGYSEIHLS